MAEHDDDEVRLTSPLPCWHESLASARTDPLVSLSLSRGFIQTARPVPAGTPLFLELSLGQSLGAEKAEIDAVAEDANGAAAELGAGFHVRFLRVDERARAWIEGHLETLRPTRAQPEPPEPVAPPTSGAPMADDDGFEVPPHTPLPVLGVSGPERRVTPASLPASFQAAITMPPGVELLPDPPAHRPLPRPQLVDPDPIPTLADRDPLASIEVATVPPQLAEAPPLAELPERAPVEAVPGAGAQPEGGPFHDDNAVEQTQRWAIPPKASGPASAPAASFGGPPKKPLPDPSQPWSKLVLESVPPSSGFSPFAAREDLESTQPWTRASLTSQPPTEPSQPPTEPAPLPTSSPSHAPSSPAPLPSALTSSLGSAPMPRIAALVLDQTPPLPAPPTDETMRWPTAQLRVAGAPLEMPVASSPDAPPPELDESRAPPGESGLLDEVFDDDASPASALAFDPPADVSNAPRLAPRTPFEGLITRPGAGGVGSFLQPGDPGFTPSPAPTDDSPAFPVEVTDPGALPSTSGGGPTVEDSFDPFDRSGGDLGADFGGDEAGDEADAALLEDAVELVDAHLDDMKDVLGAPVPMPAAPPPHNPFAALERNPPAQPAVVDPFFGLPAPARAAPVVAAEDAENVVVTAPIPAVVQERLAQRAIPTAEGGPSLAPLPPLPPSAGPGPNTTLPFFQLPPSALPPLPPPPSATPVVATAPLAPANPFASLASPPPAVDHGPPARTDPFFPVPRSPLSVSPPSPPPGGAPPKTLLFGAVDVNSLPNVAAPLAPAWPAAREPDPGAPHNTQPFAAAPRAMAAEPAAPMLGAPLELVPMELPADALRPLDDAFDLSFEPAPTPERAAHHEPAQWSVPAAQPAQPAGDDDDLPLVVGNADAPPAPAEPWIVPPKK